jgi:hypothetical protein
MSRTTALKVRRSALIAVAAALLSGTAAGAALPGQGTQTVSAIGQRLEATAFTLADQRPDGFQTNLRGLNPFDALAGEMPRTLLSSSARRSYRTPRPIRHGYNDSATRRYWSVAALRQSTGVSLQALVSSTSDPGTHAQGPGSATSKVRSCRPAAAMPAGAGSRTVKVKVRNRAPGTAVFGDSITLIRQSRGALEPAAGRRFDRRAPAASRYTRQALPSGRNPWSYVSSG